MRIMLFSVLIWGLYAIALFLPVSANPDVTGMQALSMGWDGTGLIPELANVALLLGWAGLLLGRANFAACLGIVAVALALTAPFIFEIDLNNLRMGYFSWVASCLVLAVAAATAEENNR